MKNLSELSIAILKTPNECRTDELKDILYSINNVLYKYQKRYINNKIKNNLLEFITYNGKEISQYEPKTAIGNKKKEYLLNTLRQYVKILKQYQPDETDYDNIAERTYKYVLSQYIRNKEEIINDVDKIIQTMNDMDDTYKDWDNQPPHKYTEAMRELTQAFMSKYAMLQQQQDL